MICISEGFSRDGRRPLLVGESITRCPLKWDLLILHYKTLLGFFASTHIYVQQCAIHHSQKRHSFFMCMIIKSAYRGYLLSCRLWCHTQNSCSPVGGELGDYAGRLFWEPMRISDIKWNFEKFLVGPDGKPMMRWHPSIEVSEVRADIYKYLHENKILD